MKISKPDEKILKDLWGKRTYIPFNTYLETNLDINPIFVEFEKLSEQKIVEFEYYNWRSIDFDKKQFKKKEVILKNKENRKYYDLGKKIYIENVGSLVGDKLNTICPNLMNYFYVGSYKRFIKKEKRDTGNLLNPLNIVKKNTKVVDGYLNNYIKSDCEIFEENPSSWNYIESYKSKSNDEPDDNDKFGYGNSIIGLSPSWRDWSGYVNYKLHQKQNLIRDLGMIFFNDEKGDLKVIEDSTNFYSSISISLNQS